MEEQFAGIATSAGTIPTFMVRPERRGPFPAAILFIRVTDIRRHNWCKPAADLSAPSIAPTLLRFGF